MIGALVGQVLWLGFCFGTVIVGLLLLFTMPMVLIWPAATGIPAGLVIFFSGWAMWKDGEPYRYSEKDEAFYNTLAERERRIDELRAKYQQKPNEVEDVTRK